MTQDKHPYDLLISGAGRGRLMVFSALAGACGAVPVVLYRLALSWADGARGALLAGVGTIFQGILYLAGLVAAGLVVGRMTRREPLISGSGIPQIKAQLQGRLSPRWLRVLLLKFAGGSLSAFAGLSLGREGPSIQLGAMAAQGMSERAGLPAMERKYLLVCGACGGLAAAFNAPLAGILFAIEEIHRNFSYMSLMPAMIAALTADLISKAFFGVGPTLGFSALPVLPFAYLPLFVLTGIALGLLGVLYNRTLLATQALYRRLAAPVWLRVAVPFAVAGALAFLWPQLLGSGHHILMALWRMDLPAKMMAALLVGKFCFSMVSYCSGAPGGIFFPMLVLGALAGCILGRAAAVLFGLPDQAVLTFMMMGMAGVFAAIVRAPITGIILVVEMTGAITQLAWVGVVACMATLTANALKCRPIYDSLLDAMTGDAAKEEEKHNDIIRVSVPLGSAAEGIRVHDLALPEGCLIIAIEREGSEVLPGGDTALRASDLLSIAMPREKTEIVRDILEKVGIVSE